MSFRKSLSLLTILVFGFVFCLTVTFNGARAQQVTRSDQSMDGELMEGDSGQAEEKEEGERTGSFYQSDTTTNAFGAIMTQWQFGPDVGYGETGQGYSYTDPLTGAYVSYQTSGIGMGAVGLPMYGGMNSQFGTASYGPFAGGQMPTQQSTPGYDTQTSIGGDAFGTQYSYSQGTPNYTAMTGYSLMQNPSTAGLGLAMLYGYGTGAAGGLGTSSFGLGASALGSFSSPFTSSYASPYASSFGSSFASPYASSFGSSFASPVASSYARPYTTSIYSSPYTATSGYSNPYAATSSYGYPTNYGTSAYGYPTNYGTSAYGYQNPYGGSSYYIY